MAGQRGCSCQDSGLALPLPGAARTVLQTNGNQANAAKIWLRLAVALLLMNHHRVASTCSFIGNSIWHTTHDPSALIVRIRAIRAGANLRGAVALRCSIQQTCRQGMGMIIGATNNIVFVVLDILRLSQFQFLLVKGVALVRVAAR